MPPAYNYTERNEDKSPSSATFTFRQQSASGLYLTDPAAYADMPRRVVDVLGYTNTRSLNGNDAGKIGRRLPLRHPQWQWLFADSFRPRGVGSTYQTVTPLPGPGSSIIPQFPLYATYECDIAFSSREYNCWQDKDIKVYSSIGYQKDGSSYAFRYATEWLRFCKFELMPLNNFISAQQGQMRFRTAGGDPDGIQYQDAPRMYLPDSSLRVTWFGVPYRYVTSANSYLRKFIGHVNQTAWGDEQVLEWGAFGPYQPGELLYHGARPLAIYFDPVPDEGVLAFNMNNSFTKARVCDLELNFTYTARTAGVAPPNMGGVNRNWVAAGHNLLPWITTRNFYYATTFDPANPADQSKWVPSYRSFPFSLLFTDPDVNTSPRLDP